MCLKFFIVKSFEIAESSLGNTCLLPARCMTACPWTLPTLQNGSDFWSLNSVIFPAEENLNFLCSASLIKLPKTFRLFIQMAGARFGSFFGMTRQIALLELKHTPQTNFYPHFIPEWLRTIRNGGCTVVSLCTHGMSHGLGHEVWRVLPLRYLHLPKVVCGQERFCNKSFL